MNQPASFVHWSIFDVTVANLVLIAVMVVIFGAALLLPFPRGDREELAPVTGMATDGATGDGTAAVSDPADDGAAGRWTSRLRRSWYRRPAPGPVLRTGPGSGSGSGNGSGSLDELAVGQPANGAKKA
jgi:hypothetical protein